MAIKSPSTYSDWYWKNFVDATALYDETVETAFAPYFRGLFADLPDIAALPAGMRQFIEVLAEPPSAGFGGFALGVGVEMIDETLHAVMNPAMKIMARAINKRAKETWLTGEQANTLFRQGKIEKDYWNLVTESEGFEDIIAKQVYESQQPYPSIPDLILYARYHGNPENTKEIVWDWFDVPVRDFGIWEWLAKQRLTTLQVQTLFKRGKITKDEVQNTL
ncbi:unnamed protein product, partial [marine sediment metagenome]